MIFLKIMMSLLVHFFTLSYFNHEWNREEEKNAGSEKQKWLIGLVSLCVNFVFAVIAKDYCDNLLSYTRLIVLYQIIFCAAVTDYRKKIIPNTLILVGMVCQIIWFLVEVFWYQDNWKRILMQDVMGFIMGAGVLLLVYLFAKNAIGMGDIKLFGVLGITCGFELTYTILFLAVLLASCYGLYLILVRKKKKDYEMAFAPFIFVGYITSVFISVL